MVLVVRNDLKMGKGKFKKEPFYFFQILSFNVFRKSRSTSKLILTNCL